jgi:hypothetical protein
MAVVRLLVTRMRAHCAGHCHYQAGVTVAELVRLITSASSLRRLLCDKQRCVLC